MRRSLLPETEGKSWILLEGRKGNMICCDSCASASSMRAIIDDLDLEVSRSMSRIRKQLYNRRRWRLNKEKGIQRISKTSATVNEKKLWRLLAKMSRSQLEKSCCSVGDGVREIKDEVAIDFSLFSD